jgi:hypothetical protein
LGNFFHRFSKWRRFSKWLSSELVCVLFCDLGLYFDSTYFIEEKFFVRFKLTSDVQYGGQKSKQRNFGIWQYFGVLSFAMRFYLTSNMGNMSQDGGSKSYFLA